MASTTKDQLESVSLSLEELIALVNVSRTAFDDQEAFSKINPADVSGTFSLIARNLQDIKDSVTGVLGGQL